MDEDPIFGLEQDVVLRISLKRFVQVHAQDFQLSVLCLAKHLRVREGGVWRCASGQKYRVSEIDCAVGEMVAWVSHFPIDGYDGGVFKIETAEHANRVEWLQLWIFIRASGASPRLNARTTGV